MSSNQIMTNLLLLTVCFLTFLFRNSRKGLRNALVLSTVLLAFFAYHFYPTKDMDLAHHFISVNTLKNSRHFFESTQIDVLPGFRILLQIISKMPSEHYLPAFVALVVYGLLFFIIFDWANTIGKRRELWITVTLFCCTLSFIGTISNVRNTMGVTIFVTALYLELIKKRNRIICWLLMAIAASIHPAITIFILIRILVQFYTKYSQKPILVALFLFPLILQYSVPMVSQYIKIPYFSYVIEKIDLYIFEASEFNAKRFYVCLFQLFVYTFIILRYRKRNSESLLMWDNYILCVLVFTYATIGKYILMVRMADSLLVLCCPYVVSEARMKAEKKLTVNRFSALIILFSISMLLLHNFYSGYYYASNYVW